ncbi:MAG: proteasome subunit beta [Promethearchaeota archaeon]
MWSLRERQPRTNDITREPSANDMTHALKGTTTVGLCSQDGIVLVTDRRATTGFLIANKRAVKVYKLDKFVGATIAGRVADAQQIIDIAKAEFALYYLNHGRRIPIHSAARFLGNILFGNRAFPMIIQCIVAGVKPQPHLYTLDPLGSVIEEKTFVATGSGAPIAYGILEDSYSPDLTIEDGLNIALRTVRAATQRDAATGNGYNIATITQTDGCEILSEEQIDTLIKKFDRTNK